jgi:Domain of unknown function (DUF4280)
MLVVAGATLTCSFGVAPSTLSVLPKPASGTGFPIATITDTIPMTNINTFGMCQSPANPAVQAATTAASGVFTPAPCIPATGAPWQPPSLSVAVQGIPAVPQTSVCMCQWAGVVSVTQAGQIAIAIT